MMIEAAQLQSPLVPDLTELIIGLVTFGIIFGALWKLLLPRMSTMLATRTDQIEGGLRRAEDAQAEANQVLDQYRAQLADARHEASAIRERAKEEAAQILAEARTDAVAERQRILDAANAQRDADRQQALTSLRAEVGSLAIELASKIVGESLEDEARQSRMVDRFLEDLDSEAASGAASR
jgi:F-type H+-transporting ATPase subunit b